MVNHVKENVKQPITVSFILKKLKLIKLINSLLPLINITSLIIVAFPRDSSLYSYNYKPKYIFNLQISMKNNLLLMIITLLFTTCSKDESADYYFKKAEQKLIEIDALVKTYPCGNLSNWKVDAIAFRYYPISTIPNIQYERLKKEYEQLIAKANRLDPRPSSYDMLYLPPISVECIDGHPKVMTANDYTLEQAVIVLDSKIAEFEKLTTNITCNGSEQWVLHQIIKDCKIEYAVSDQKNKNLLQNIAQLTNAIYALQMHIVVLDPSKRDCYHKFGNWNTPFEVKCENNKPVIHIKN